MTARHRLFGEFAHRYDLHTPAHHYQDDHRFVLDLARRVGGEGASILDVGCGTGVFLARARDEGFRVAGIDKSTQMVAACERKLGPGVARVDTMEALDAVAQFDLVCALSWTLNYVNNEAALRDVIVRIARSLRPDGAVVLQVAHAANATGAVWADREPADDGEVTLFCRFRAGEEPESLLADYVYAWPEKAELAFETHALRVADARLVVGACMAAGLANVNVFESFRGEPLCTSISPLVTARKTASP